MEFSMFINSEPSDEELLFVTQLGVRNVFTYFTGNRTNYDFLSRLKEQTEKRGLNLIRVMNGFLGKCDAIHLALPERDQRIDEFIEFLEALNRIDVQLTTFTWESNGVWSSEPVLTRNSITRSVHLEQLKNQANTHGRIYTRPEMWESFHYFMQRVVPAAASSGVTLLLHPNDPPTDSLGGIACLITSRRDYERAFQAADNRILKMEFCCGCWLEGGNAFGNVLEDLEYFIGEGRVGEIHFRNVSSTLPDFTETFLDDGYMDMSRIMNLLVGIGYDGTVTLDHTPEFTEWAGGKRAATAYAIGYMKALYKSAGSAIGG